MHSCLSDTSGVPNELTSESIQGHWIQVLHVFKTGVKDFEFSPKFDQKSDRPMISFRLSSSNMLE